MVNIMISGALGAMGKNLIELIEENPLSNVICGFDKEQSNLYSFPIYNDFSKIKEKIDVVIDFSHFSVVDNLIDFCVENKIALVCATTGLNKSSLEKLKEASKVIPIFKTGNFSYGISVLTKLVENAAKLLCEDFDVEIIEKHHNKKVDAPSGTAFMLAQAVSEGANKEFNIEYSRYGKDCKRKENDLTIHAVRGGTIVGEHSVIFAGKDEVIEINHSAYNKKVFAVGALKAAMYIYDKKPSYYEMKDISNI